MRNIAARLDALEAHFEVVGCTCAEMDVLHQKVDEPLSASQVASQLASLPSCLVHGRAPAGLTVIVTHYGDSYRRVPPHRSVHDGQL